MFKTKITGILSKLRHYVPKSIIKALFYSFFQPHVEYCMNIWTCAPQSTLVPIEISMKKAIRTLSFAKYDAHSGPLFKAYNILNFPDLLKLQEGKLQWDLRNGSYPEFLKKNLLFVNISQAERLRSISQNSPPYQEQNTRQILYHLQV